jgi:hypothetical protein
MPHAPNKIDIVQRVRTQFPIEWGEAHMNYPSHGPMRDRAEAFIRRLAWVLNKEVDSRFKLNVKDNQANGKISQDGIAFVVGNKKEFIDVIESAGSPNAKPSWSYMGEGPANMVEEPSDPGGSLPPTNSLETRVKKLEDWVRSFR